MLRKMPKFFLLTYHINTVVTWVKREQIVSDEVCLLVEPLDLKNEPLFLHLFHFRFVF